MNALLLLCSVSFLLSLISVLFIKNSLSQQLIDIPNERSSHTQPTPRGGGLGFIIAFAVILTLSQLLNLNLVNSELYLPWLLLIPLIMIGILDDWKDIPSSIRYLVQFLVSTLVVGYCGAFPFPFLTQLGTLGEFIASLLTIIGMTALINFYNFMDGLDGLVAGVTAVQLGFLALWFNQPSLWLLVAALVGFLYWNWSPAKIFMGDVGSTILGGVVAIAFLTNNNTPTSAWLAVTILLPLIGDAIYTLCRRLSRGENIFKAHRSHLYQRLQQSGWPHTQVASTYMGMTLVIAVSVYYFGILGAIGSVIGVLIAIAIAETYLTLRVKPKRL